MTATEIREWQETSLADVHTQILFEIAAQLAEMNATLAESAQDMGKVARMAGQKPPHYPHRG